MDKIIVYAEIKNEIVENSTLELVSKAYELKENSDSKFNTNIKVEVVAIAKNMNESEKKKIYNAGASKIVLIRTFLESRINQTIYSKFFTDYYRQYPSDIILFPATEKTRMVAPRITTMLETGLVADCTELEIIEKNNEIKLASTRPTFGGELMATILSRKNPQCATVRPGTFKIKNTNIENGEYVEFNADLYAENRIKLLGSLICDDTQSNSLLNAKIVLAGGYGIVSAEKKEYFEKLQKIAKIINASVACTRKIVDYGIMPPSFQVGQTGYTISPDLYVAFGISGAIQHTIGMKNSKTVIAINCDKNAEIFKYADYKIVENAQKIIDEMLEAID